MGAADGPDGAADPGVTFLPADKLPDDPERLELRKDAQVVLQAYRECLKHPAFRSRIDLAVLTRIATTEAMPARERRKAATMLATIFNQSVDQLAKASGVREQVLGRLGLSDPRDRPVMLSIHVPDPKVRTPFRLDLPTEEPARPTTSASAPPTAMLPAPVNTASGPT